ncbi:hypothetical protein ROHU_007803 [Labeo rohita]|uniref:Uncharacterized protein n=1 Tax=Labeo rohita TaxID=84645 RepID=A0A498MFM1_LABRO|nr:hypothetical protein ROHU_007803 [Labeo rohita]
MHNFLFLSSASTVRNRSCHICEDTERKNLKTLTEDVLYASIDHGNISPNRPVRDVDDNDCDYAVVKLPQNTTNTVKHTITEDSSDDYVLMG